MDFGKVRGSVDADDIADVVRLVVENREVISRLGQLTELFEQLPQPPAGAGGEAKEAAVALVASGSTIGARGFLAAP